MEGDSIAKGLEVWQKMVTTRLSFLVNQEIDAMSLRSQRGRVTFCEDIEMDSLEPEINSFLKGGVLGTIKEYEFNGQNDFEDENLNEFREFDVSFAVGNDKSE